MEEKHRLELEIIRLNGIIDVLISCLASKGVRERQLLNWYGVNNSIKAIVENGDGLNGIISSIQNFKYGIKESNNTQAGKNIPFPETIIPITKVNAPFPEKSEDTTKANAPLKDKTEDATNTNASLKNKTEDTTKTNAPLKEKTEDETETNAPVSNASNGITIQSGTGTISFEDSDEGKRKRRNYIKSNMDEFADLLRGFFGNRSNDSKLENVGKVLNFLAINGEGTMEEMRAATGMSVSGFSKQYPTIISAKLIYKEGFKKYRLTSLGEEAVLNFYIIIKTDL